MISQLIDHDPDVRRNEELDRLQEVVQHRLSSRVRGFRLVIHGRGLILLGQTTTFYSKQLAQHAIMEATTTTILANNIEVCP